MQLYAGKFPPQWRPFGIRFLHAVLAKNTMACRKNRSNTRLTMAFGDRDKLGVRRRRHCFGACSRDAIENRFEIIGRI